MNWFYLALLASAIYALVVIIDDNMVRKVYPKPIFGAIISGLLALLPLLSLFFVDITIPKPSLIITAMVAGSLFVFAGFMYFESLLKEAPPIVAALWGLTPAFVPFLAFFFLKETLTINQYVGFILILGSSLAISAVDIKKFKLSPVFYTMLIASILIAFESILLKYLFNNIDYWSGFIFVSLGMGAAAIFLMIAFKDGRKFPSDLIKLKKWMGIFFITEILAIIGFIVHALAVSGGPVSLVKVIEGTLAIYVLLFAILFYPFFPKLLREATHGNIPRKLIFMAVILIGLYIMNI